MNLIQQLKDNEKPFGRMSEEMQNKATAIGIHSNFRLYCGPHRDSWGGIILADSAFFKTSETYRLRLNYEEKPEIVECEIYKARRGRFDVYVYDFGEDEENLLSAIPHGYEQIGFKFDGIKQIINKAVGYSHNGIDILPFVDYDDLKSGRWAVLHATHVLFRRQK